MATKLATGLATGMESDTPGEKIKALSNGAFKTLAKIKPTGALHARKQANGTISFYWRYSFGEVSERVYIGDYDPSAPPKSLERTHKGYSIQAAIRKAEALATEHKNNIKDGGRPALLEAAEETKRQIKIAKDEAAKYTLKGLLKDYCDHLEKLERRSHADARSIFKLHVYDAWPKIAAMPANKVTSEQVADMMRLLIDNKKGRTSNKLRSYLRAAYQTAKAAKSKPSIPVAFKAFNVTSNPAADTEPDESQNNPDKNPLSAEDLRSYWKIIKTMAGFKGALLRLHLLTGGQRIEQLVKLLTANITPDAILLFDGKGRPGKPARPHAVPLTPLAAAALTECKPKGIHAISTDEGVTHIAATSLSRWAVEAATGIQGFKAKRIRSGVETLLASAKVSVDYRGRLQSHGISGVQARHYDGHDYMDEKRQALEILFRLLDAPEGGKVVQIRAA